MKTIKGDLILTKDTIFDEDLRVEGNIICEGGNWDLKCWNLKCRDLDCWDLDCWDIDCRDLKCLNLECWNLSFYAIAIAYHSFKCRSWKAKRDKYVIKCLDKEIEIKDKKDFCDKCGQEIKE